MIHFLWQHNIQSSSKLTFSSYIFLQHRLTLRIGIFKVTLKMRWFFVTLFVKWPRFFVAEKVTIEEPATFLFGVFHHVFCFRDVFSMAFPSSGWLFHMFSHGPGFTPRSRLRAGTLGAPGAGPVNGKMDGLRFFDVPNNHWDKEHVPKKLGHSPYFLVHNILKADMFLGSRCNSTLYGRSCTLGNCSAEGIFLATGKKLIDHQTLGFHCKHREIYVILPEIVWAILSNYKCIWKNRDGICRDWSGSGGPSGWYFCRIPQTGTSAKQIFSNVIGVGCIYAQYIEYHRTIMNYIHIYNLYIFI